jgi:phosphoglucosamine mutase
MLGMALAAGFNAAGVDVVAVGVAPTPALSFIARTGDFGLGVIISASHNPFPDNGIKLVGHDGCKLRDEVELRIEQLMEETFERPVAGGVGAFSQAPELLASYADMLVGLIPGGLDGMKVAVDGSHGAAYALGPEVLRRLGAEIVVCGDAPDGVNINEFGGATKPEVVQELTQSSGSMVGVAFDGDADRAVFSDGQGRLINGDRTIGIWAEHAQAQGRVHGNAAQAFDNFIDAPGWHVNGFEPVFQQDRAGVYQGNFSGHIGSFSGSQQSQRGRRVRLPATQSTDATGY